MSQALGDARPTCVPRAFAPDASQPWSRWRFSVLVQRTRAALHPSRYLRRTTTTSGLASTTGAFPSTTTAPSTRPGDSVVASPDSPRLANKRLKLSSWRHVSYLRSRGRTPPLSTMRRTPPSRSAHLRVLAVSSSAVSSTAPAIQASCCSAPCGIKLSAWLRHATVAPVARASSSVDNRDAFSNPAGWRR